MHLRGVLFFIIMVAGAVLNFSARKICEKRFPESRDAMMLKLKLTGLALVFAGVLLMMIFGK